jgi:hypothetical protein
LFVLRNKSRLIAFDDSPSCGRTSEYVNVAFAIFVMLTIATVAKQFRILWNLTRSGEFVQHLLPLPIVVSERFAFIEFCVMNY